MQLSNMTLAVLAALAATLNLAGCGDDSGDAHDAGGAGNAGHSGHVADASADGGSMCGSTTCAAFPPVMLPPTSLLAGLGGNLKQPTSCCTKDKNVCGVANDMLLNPQACLERDAPGEPSSACPSEMLSAFGNPVPFVGCCRPDNRCGLEGELMGVDFFTGCAERAELAEALTGSSISGFFSAPPTWKGLPCTYGETAMDAGSDDGGH